MPVASIESSSCPGQSTVAQLDCLLYFSFSRTPSVNMDLTSASAISTSSSIISGSRKRSTKKDDGLICRRRSSSGHPLKSDSDDQSEPEMTSHFKSLEHKPDIEAHLSKRETSTQLKQEVTSSSLQQVMSQSRLEVISQYRPVIVSPFEPIMTSPFAAKSRPRVQISKISLFLLIPFKCESIFCALIPWTRVCSLMTSKNRSCSQFFGRLPCRLRHSNSSKESNIPGTGGVVL